MGTTNGRLYRHFAWRPVWTEDRGWRWLRMVWRARAWHSYGERDWAGWQHWVEDPR